MSKIHQPTTHNLYVLQIHPFSSSSLKPIKNSPNQHPFTVSYLVNSCGFDPEKSLSGSRIKVCQVRIARQTRLGPRILQQPWIHKKPDLISHPKAPCDPRVRSRENPFAQNRIPQVQRHFEHRHCHNAIRSSECFEEKHGK
ncbi:hypothetical protein ACSBR1_013802 [Camellia fascicularis]